MIELSKDIIKRRQELTSKLGGVMSDEEVKELIIILQKEQKEAEKTNDFIATFAILGLLRLLSERSSK